MNDPLPSEGSKKRQSGVFLANQLVFNGILQWLTSFIRLTEEKKKDAGIYLGYQYPE